MFTRLLVGLDGSPRADSAFEEAVVLAQRFGSTVVVAYVRERNGHAANGAAMLDRARERLDTAGLQAELAEREGEPDVELAARFATVVGSTIHLIHAAADRDAGLQVVGVAEALLSMQRVPFVTHVEPGTPGEVVARVIKRTRCDALFAGAHLSHEHGRPSAVLVSHAEEILRHTDIPVVIQP